MGGASFTASSWLWVRMLVFSLARTALTTMSSDRLVSPMTMPS